MVAGVACYTRGCQQPIIGQCPGYKSSCGQFYCSSHSSNRLCNVCATRKYADDAEAERQARLEWLFNEYSVAAETVPLSAIGAFITSLLLILVGFFTAIGGIDVLSALSHYSENPLLYGTQIQGNGILFIVGLTICIVILVTLCKISDSRVAAITAEKPGFDKFYAEWCKYKQQARQQAKAERNHALLGVLLGLGLIVAPIASNVARQIERDNRLD